MKPDAVTPPMTVDEARSVIWPFRRYDGIGGNAIGKLLDQGLINANDLDYAVQRAYEQRVRDAAKTLLTQALNNRSEQTSSFGPLKLVSSDRRTFAERRQLQLAMILGAVATAALGCPLFWIIYTLFLRNEPSQNTEVLDNLDRPSYIIALIIVGLMIVAITGFANFLLNLIMNYLDRQMQLYRKGQLGEQRVLNLMYQVLDGRWWVFQNLELPGQNKDVDLVLVGPTGVWSVEIKSLGGDYRTVGDRWERRFQGQWLPAFKNPTKQAKRNAQTLSRILATHNLKQWIEPVIVWANPDSKLQIENPSAPVWQLDQIAENIKNLAENRPVTEEQRNKIVEIFKGLYKEPFT